MKEIGKFGVFGVGMAMFWSVIFGLKIAVFYGRKTPGR